MNNTIKISINQVLKNTLFISAAFTTLFVSNAFGLSQHRYSEGMDFENPSSFGEYIENEVESWKYRYDNNEENFNRDYPDLGIHKLPCEGI